MKRLILAWMLIFSSLGKTTLAQSDFSRPVNLNFGSSIIDELLPEGFPYNPLTLLASTSLYSFGAFSIYGETQFTKAFNILTRQSDFEFGVNAGILWQLALANNWTLNAAIGSGPHFISVQTRLQSDGFIFSDNFEAGLSYYIPIAGMTFNLKGRFRHISNAGLKTPNWGIDNLFLIIGLGSVF